MRTRIAVLMHQNARALPLTRYSITHLAYRWANDGNKVMFIFGDKQFVPADIAIVHVDLSVVPNSYLELANRYPIVINGRVRDIRKSNISKNLLSYGNPYPGKVIVKSNLNFAGMPERIVMATDNQQNQMDFKLPKDYRIYDNISEVPEKYFNNIRFVIEKFLPEREDDFFCVRNYLFLGDQTICYKSMSHKPVINGSAWESIEIVEPHPEVLAWREELHFDYGKFDYVLHEGKPILLDANKTVGVPPKFHALEEIWNKRAKGLYSFLAA